MNPHQGTRYAEWVMGRPSAQSSEIHSNTTLPSESSLTSALAKSSTEVIHSNSNPSERTELARRGNVRRCELALASFIKWPSREGGAYPDWPRSQRRSQAAKVLPYRCDVELGECGTEISASPSGRAGVVDRLRVNFAFSRPSGQTRPSAAGRAARRGHSHARPTMLPRGQFVQHPAYIPPYQPS